MRRLLRHAAFLATLSCAAVQASTTSGVTPTCPDDLSFCDGRCVHGQTDAENCGECGNGCAHGLSCQSGRCTCPNLLESLCSNACVDTHADPANCGACGVACPAGEVCRDSRCACRENARCNGVCVSLASDALNCGVCGGNCGSHATCVDGRCLVTLAETENNAALAVGAGFVFWASGSAIHKVSVQGGPISTVATSAQGVPEDLVLDGANLYWTNSTLEALMKTPIAGGPSTLLASNLGPFLGGIAVDATNVYVVARVRFIDTIFAVPIAGGAPRPVFATQARIFDLAADSLHLFWSQSFGVTDGSINFKTATGGTTVLVTNVQYLRSSIAVRGTRVFWATKDEIAQAPITGGIMTTLATATSPSGPVVGERSVYWMDHRFAAGAWGEVRRVSIGGGEPTVLWAPQAGIRQLAVEGASLYILTDKGLFQLSPI